MILPLPGETWQHFKGQRYEIVAIARHSETREELVIYQKAHADEPATSSQPWARPLSMFVEAATVKPTEPGEPNCLHKVPEKFVVRDGIHLVQMFCQECIDGAELGRFVRVLRADGTVP